MTLWAPPAVPEFAGAPTQAIMDGWIQATLGFQTTGIAFRAERHASQTLTSGASNTLDYDTVIEDPYSGWNSGSFKWFAPYTGWYAVTVTGAISTATMTIAPLIVTPQGTLAGARLSVVSTFPGIASASEVVSLIGGSDWVQGALYTSASGTTNTVNGRYCSIEISYVSQT